MNKKFIFIIFISLLIITGCINQEWIQNMVAEDTHDISYDVNMKRDILCLMMAYPEYVTNVEKLPDGKVYIIMKSGTKILYDDKRIKSNNEKLNNPDVQDMMEQIYPLTDAEHLMNKDFDPGRIRVYPLLKSVYGNSNSNVQSKLDNVKIGYKYCPFNSNNRAADSLKAVMKELAILAKNKQQIYSFVYPVNGTFNYRYISGTNRLSPHSFGIAIDLKSHKSDYWKWASKEAGEKRLCSYPKEVVKTFEKNNFIWGGKWNHFDILHFEYRPEIILKARYFSQKPSMGKPWYDGIDSLDDKVKNYIRLIEKALE